MWEAVKEYFTTIGNQYDVNPILYLGINVGATPLFIFASSWFVKRYKKKQKIILPAITCVLIFHAADTYLILFGKNLPLFFYFILASTSIITGYFSCVKIKNKVSN